jgi:molecular chaperone IbpA
MTTFDFSPLFRTMVGFDRLNQALETALHVDDSSVSYPPYNIERTGEDSYRITMAVAGFARDEMNVETHDNELVIAGSKEGADEPRAYLHRGIAGRNFERRFQLADYVRVADAHLADGLLHVDLVRELPEAMKPRKIDIQASRPASIGAKVKGVLGGKAA